jgi:hypothetical protein
VKLYASRKCLTIRKRMTISKKEEKVCVKSISIKILQDIRNRLEIPHPGRNIQKIYLLMTGCLYSKISNRKLGLNHAFPCLFNIIHGVIVNVIRQVKK